MIFHVSSNTLHFNLEIKYQYNIHGRIYGIIILMRHRVNTREKTNKRFKRRENVQHLYILDIERW